MANTKISALTAVASLSTADTLPVVQAGTTMKTTIALFPVSTAMQTALDAKAPLSSPALVNLPTAPTAAAGTATTQIATTAFVDAAKRIVPSTVKTASYTLMIADAGTLVRMNVASANTLTVPPNSSAAIPTDSVIMVNQYGAGITTITPGTGVTLRPRGGLLALNGQYASASLHKIATDEWLISGDLA